MTFNDMYIVLKQSNIPQKRLKSSKALTPPYMVVCEGNEVYGGADNKALFKEHNPRAELYTIESDYISYNTLCTVLNNNNLLFSASEETPIPEEGVFVRYIEIETQIDKI